MNELKELQKKLISKISDAIDKDTPSCELIDVLNRTLGTINDALNYLVDKE